MDWEDPEEGLEAQVERAHAEDEEDFTEKDNIIIADMAAKKDNIVDEDDFEDIVDDLDD